MRPANMRRLAALESANEPGMCNCPNNGRVVWPDNYAAIWGQEPPPTDEPYCPLCGGRRVDTHVEYTNDWRTYRESKEPGAPRGLGS